MLCVVIKGPSFKDAEKQITSVIAYTNLIELRLDLFSALDLNSLRDLKAKFAIPMLFTLRSQKQGGQYPHSEKQRLSDIEMLATLNPEYVDIEYDTPLSLTQSILSFHPTIKIISSYHNFTSKIPDYDELHKPIQNTLAHFYKIAITTESTVSTLKFLLWAKQFSDKMIPIAMGSYGQISRLLGPVLDCPITYASLNEEESILGQLSAKTLVENYHFHSLTPKTALYGLIGYPLDKSISDIRHNYVFANCGINALYLKMPVPPSDLKEFLILAKEFSFKGLSVTMPLKEAILPFIDSIDAHAKEIGAVNTLIFKEGNYTGFNTDGIGALNVIEKKFLVKDKHICVIGAGGASKAIIHESIRRGAHVTIINRNKEKAELLAKQLHCNYQPIKTPLSCSYDILINCTPADMPISAADIILGSLVMDIKNDKTPLLECAFKKGCLTLHGSLMFIEQAIYQYTLWFKDSNNFESMQKALENKVLEP